jgi:hypothetical protein
MEAFAPCLGVNNAVFIAITTALDDDNYITRMFMKKDPKSLELFTTIHINVYCEDCQKKGISSLMCMQMKHMEYALPAWKATRNIEQVAKLLSQDELFASEQAGAIRARKCVFEAAWINKLSQAALLTTSEIVNSDQDGFGLVFTYIDPSGGGKQSDLALLSLAILANQKIVICGMSRGRNRDHREEEKTVRGHFDALRSHPACRNALFVDFIENNLGGAPAVSRIQSMIADYQPQLSYNEILTFPGVRTTSASREQGIALAIHALQSGNVCFAQQVACNEPIEYKNVRELFLNQLGRIQKKIKPSRGDINKYEYSGKSENTPDDLGMAFPDALRWIAEYQRLEHYKRVQNVINQAGTLEN